MVIWSCKQTHTHTHTHIGKSFQYLITKILWHILLLLTLQEYYSITSGKEQSISIPLPGVTVAMPKDLITAALKNFLVEWLRLSAVEVFSELSFRFRYFLSVVSFWFKTNLNIRIQSFFASEWMSNLRTVQKNWFGFKYFRKFACECCSDSGWDDPTYYGGAAASDGRMALR